MERLYAIVRKYFKKHWRMIASQIHAVNSVGNPKRGFLYDCGAINVDALIKLIKKLKEESLIGKDIVVASIKEDIFILNTTKFHQESRHVIIDISGSLTKPTRMDAMTDMFVRINEQLEAFQGSDVVDLKLGLKLNLKLDETWCIPTIFGYLINYPILYYLKGDENCLSLVDLQVFQVTSNNDILVSFSVPSEIYQNDSNVKEVIDSWLQSFQNGDYFSVKSFIANYPTVVL